MPSDLKIVEPVDDDSVLPPGQRDGSGFWYPLDCNDPKTLVRRRRPRRARKARRSGENRRPENRLA